MEAYPLAILLSAILSVSSDLSIGIGLAVAAMIVFLLCVAAVSAGEIAFFSLTPAQLAEIRSRKNSTNQLISELLDHPKKLLATLLITSNFFNVGIVILSTYITASLFDLSLHPVLTFVVQVIVVTSLIVLIGEIMPKVYASNYPDRIVTIMAYPVNILKKIFSPLSMLLVSSTTIIDRRMVKRKYSPSMDDLSDAIDITADGKKDEDDTRILKSITRFGDIQVREIMQPRVDVVAVDAGQGFEEVVKLIIDAGFSRMPVYKDSIDQILGILYIKDLLAHFGNNDKFDWTPLVRPAFFVPENKPINDLLLEFREKKIHMAVVVDEYGGTSGIITLEDIIEEIVGDINDEFDSESDHLPYTMIDENTYIFEGKTLLNDLCKITGIDDRTFDEVKGESDTLAGLLLEIAGKIPVVNDSMQFLNYTFKVEAADKRRIKRVKVHIGEETDVEE